MDYSSLKEQVLEANLAIQRAGLVTLTWGNASGADRDAGVMAIKPSGVPYEQVTPDDIVVLDLDDGRVVEGKRRPSSDSPTHLYVYRFFDAVNGIVHVHSTHATAWAQAQRPIPCYGTTHADHFHGAVPVTRPLEDQEIRGAYEHATGKAIVECFSECGLDPLEMPGVLVPMHGPFAWGATPKAAVRHAIILEEIARMACLTVQLNPARTAIPEALLERHYQRKHGPDAYYGQK